MKWEDLGRKVVDNVEVVGSREVMTIEWAFMGNEKEQPVVKEFWYSPRLGINVTTKRFDPRASAVQNFVGGQYQPGGAGRAAVSSAAGYRMVPMDARRGRCKEGQ